MTTKLEPHPFLNPAVCFSVACVAFSIVALSTVWRHSRTTVDQDTSSGQAETNGVASRQLPNSNKNASSRPTPQRRRAADSLYANEDQYQVNISELIALCSRVQQFLTYHHPGPDEQHSIQDVSSEISLLTVTLCRLQQELSTNTHGFRTAAGLQACLDAAIYSLRLALQSLEARFSIDQTGSLDARSGPEQLRAQRAVLKFVMDSIAGDVPPTPSSDVGEDARLLQPPADITPTGITPGIDEIEPPPEYSPPTSSSYPVIEEKKKSDTKPDAPSPECEISPPDASALYDAVNANNTDTLSTLLSNGANPTLPFGDLQRTPLHLSAHLNHCTCTGILLKNGADMSHPDARGDTPLHLAAWAGNVEVLSILLSHGADVDWLSGRDGYSPLWCAISAYQIDAARLLLKHGARVSLRAASGSGMVPLHQAAVTGQSAMCELLLDRGAQVDSVDDDKNTPLHYAASCGSVASVKVLLRGGADIEARQTYGLTAVHWAAHKGHTEVLSTLLEHGARCDQRAEDGATPLHLAAARGHVAASKVLVERGASRRAGSAAWDGIEGTPVEMAKQRGHSRLVRTLRA